MKYILGICMIVNVGIGYAQYSVKISMPNDRVNNSYTLLLDYVEQSYSDKEEIARFFYLWIARNIKYDDALVNQYKIDLNPDLLNMSALEVFETKLAICSGYAKLYKLFLNEFDIECEVVDGYSKTKEKIISGEEMLTHHSWNAMSLNGNWYLTDPTWASTSSSEERLTEYYFKTPPDLFLFNHFPTIDFWQLNDDPISIKEFQRLPEVSATYFELGFDQAIPKVLVEDNQAKLIIGNSKKWKLSLSKRTALQAYETVSFKGVKKGDVQELIFSISDVEKSIIKLDAYKFVDLNEIETYSQLITFGLE